MAKRAAKPKILHIPIKREYFDAIRSGDKKEEYRAYTPFWESRLRAKDEKGEYTQFRHYDIVRFRNGYEPDSPVMEVEFKETIVERFVDAPEDADISERYGFAIVLGEVIGVENI